MAKSNHPNFRLWCLLALIPIVIILLTWCWCYWWV